ncbi:MAG: sortase, partial [Clostridia bacterium]
MFKSRYSNFLTIVLIIAIIFVIVLVSVLAVSTYKRYKSDKDAENAISQFENNINQNTENNTNTSGEGLIEQNIITDNNTNSSGEGTRKVTYYNNFVMIGYIEIPKIGKKLPILEKETVASLEQSVAVRYPDNPKLNTPGNVVIAGHNYRNGQFFSNLKNVATGDIIKITDTSGQTLTYTIYEKYETTPKD